MVAEKWRGHSVVVVGVTGAAAAVTADAAAVRGCCSCRHRHRRRFYRHQTVVGHIRHNHLLS